MAKNKVLVNGKPKLAPVEVTTGLRLLGQPVGGEAFCITFMKKKLENNIQQCQKLLTTVTDHHTALALFSRCTLHKLPHLLGSEVLYRANSYPDSGWDNWKGPLAHGINEMVRNFLASISGVAAIPDTALRIAYIAIAHGGLGLMDAHTRAVPDFVLTMTQAIRYAETGIFGGRQGDLYLLPLSLRKLFMTRHNPTSNILRTYYRYVADVALHCTPDSASDPLEYIQKGSFKSMRDRARHAVSKQRKRRLYNEADETLKPLLQELLITSSSYPLIGMARSIPAHRRPNDLFRINLCMKLHLPLFEDDQRPRCICGERIDHHGMHIFRCKRVSKKAIHDRINRESALPIGQILQTCGIIASNTDVRHEPPRIIPGFEGLRPLDSYFRPAPVINSSNAPPIPYSRIGWDFTIPPPQGYLPPSRQ